MRYKYCNKFSHILLMAKTVGYFPHLAIQYNVLSFAARYSRGINITVESFTAVTHNELFWKKQVLYIIRIFNYFIRTNFKQKTQAIKQLHWHWAAEEQLIYSLLNQK